MRKFQLKERVCLREDNGKLGIIVQLIGREKCKVLWDADWHTGRTYVYNNAQIKKTAQGARQLAPRVYARAGACAKGKDMMVYKVIDDETGQELHKMFPRHGALMWAARWCDANNYVKIDINDEENIILVSRGEYVSRRQDD